MIDDAQPATPDAPHTCTPAKPIQAQLDYLRGPASPSVDTAGLTAVTVLPSQLGKRKADSFDGSDASACAKALAPADDSAAAQGPLAPATPIKQEPAEMLLREPDASVAAVPYGDAPSAAAALAPQMASSTSAAVKDEAVKLDPAQAPANINLDVKLDPDHAQPAQSHYTAEVAADAGAQLEDRAFATTFLAANPFTPSGVIKLRDAIKPVLWLDASWEPEEDPNLSQRSMAIHRNRCAALLSADCADVGLTPKECAAAAAAVAMCAPKRVVCNAFLLPHLPAAVLHGSEVVCSQGRVPPALLSEAGFRGMVDIDLRSVTDGRTTPDDALWPEHGPHAAVNLRNFRNCQTHAAWMSTQLQTQGARGLAFATGFSDDGCAGNGGWCNFFEGYWAQQPNMEKTLFRLLLAIAHAPRLAAFSYAGFSSRPSEENITGVGGYFAMERKVGTTSGSVFFRTMNLLADAARLRAGPPLRLVVCPPLCTPRYGHGRSLCFATPQLLPESAYENPADIRRQDWGKYGGQVRVEQQLVTSLKAIFVRNEGACLVGWELRANEHDAWMSRVNAAVGWPVLRTFECKAPEWDLMDLPEWRHAVRG